MSTILFLFLRTWGDASRRQPRPSQNFTSIRAVWRLPLAEKYDSMLRSRIADIANIGGRYAGSITAAQFLKRFVGDTAWAHLDIAGTAYVKEAHDQGPKGPTGYGARLLFEFARKDG